MSTARQVIFGGPSDGHGADGPACFLDGGGEVAEVALIAAHASSKWQLAIRIDGKHVLGSPFAWEVRPGAPSAERSLIHAPWLGENKGAAGVLHSGVLELRDKMGNECAEGCCADGQVQIWLREEFVVHEAVPAVPQPPRNPFAGLDAGGAGEAAAGGRGPPGDVARGEGRRAARGARLARGRAGGPGAARRARVGR